VIRHLGQLEKPGAVGISPEHPGVPNKAGVGNPRENMGEPMVSLEMMNKKCWLLHIYVSFQVNVPF